MLSDLLSQEEVSLAADKERYVDIIQRGAEARSCYGGEIAHISDSMAVASARDIDHGKIEIESGGPFMWIHLRD